MKRLVVTGDAGRCDQILRPAPFNANNAPSCATRLTVLPSVTGAVRISHCASGPASLNFQLTLPEFAASEIHSSSRVPNTTAWSISAKLVEGPLAFSFQRSFPVFDTKA